MAMSDADRRTAARHLARQMFVVAEKTANMNLDDLFAAIGAIDDFFVGLASDLTGAQTVEVNLNNALPQPFKGTATIGEKALALTSWAEKRGGLI